MQVMSSSLSTHHYCNVPAAPRRPCADRLEVPPFVGLKDYSLQLSGPEYLTQCLIFPYTLLV